jgi:hypothetical protein
MSDTTQTTTTPPTTPPAGQQPAQQPVVGAPTGAPMTAQGPVAGVSGHVGVGTLSAPVQTTYPTEMPIGFSGMPATMVGWDADSYIVETVAGIGFGRAVSQSTNSERCVILGGTQVNFRGVAYRDITLPPKSPAFAGYPQYETAGICRRGDIWLDVKEAVIVTDPVAFDTATGQFGKTGIIVPNAQWMRGAAINGLALARFHAPYRAAA